MAGNVSNRHYPTEAVLICRGGNILARDGADENISSTDPGAGYDISTAIGQIFVHSNVDKRHRSVHIIGDNMVKSEQFYSTRRQR